MATTAYGFRGTEVDLKELPGTRWEPGRGNTAETVYKSRVAGAK